MTTQPQPTPNDRPAVWPQVVEDMKARHELGIKRYGTPLQPFNGRAALRDAYEEALDLAVYLRQAMIEREEMISMIRELANLAGANGQRGPRLDNLLDVASAKAKSLLAKLKGGS